MPGAKPNLDGVSFYGHYTFDYQMNNKIAGMLSVNGITGDMWLHTWHGDFIQELEVKYMRINWKYLLVVYWSLDWCLLSHYRSFSADLADTAAMG